MKRQSEYYDRVYRAVCKHYKNHTIAPTVRDICKLSGIGSTFTVNSYLNRLVDDGLITREKGKSRSIQLTGKSPALAPMKLYDVLPSLKELNLCEDWTQDGIQSLWTNLHTLIYELQWIQPETKQQAEARRIALEVIEQLFGVVDDLLPVETV